MQILSYTSRMFWIIISFCDRNTGYYFLAFFVQCMNGNLTHLFHDWNFHSWIYGYRYWIYVWNNYDVSSAQFFASFSSDPIMIDPLSYQSSHEFIFKVRVYHSQDIKQQPAFMAKIINWCIFLGKGQKMILHNFGQGTKVVLNYSKV